MPSSVQVWVTLCNCVLLTGYDLSNEASLNMESRHIKQHDGEHEDDDDEHNNDNEKMLFCPM